MKYIFRNKTIICLFVFFLLNVGKTNSENSLKIKDGVLTGYRGFKEAKTLDVPSQIISIGRQAFEEDRYLKELNMSDCEMLRLIDYAAFQRCELLEDIKFPKNIEIIGAFSFNYCKKLLSVDLSNCELLTSIEEYAFNKCTSLKTLKLPKNLKKIGNRAFYKCNNLKEIDLSHCKTLEYIGEKAFDFSRSSSYEKPNSVVIKLPFNVSIIYENSFGSRDYCKELFIPKNAKELRQKIIKSGFPKERIREY